MDLDCDNQQEIWNVYEADLRGLEDQRRRFLAVYEKQTNPDGRRLVADLLDNVIEAQQRMIEMQYEIENWLIDHECEGWVMK